MPDLTDLKSGRFNQEEDDDVLMPKWLFEGREESLTRLLFATANKKVAKSFINKLEMCTNYKVNLIL